MRTALMLLVLTAAALAGCTDDSSADTAVLCTNFGAITIELFADEAPKTVANFVAHAESGYYDGVVFHRIIPEFMMQGGDPTGTGRGGETADGKVLMDEFHPDLRHSEAGILSMANAGANTGSSQFFLTFKETPHLDDKHAIFAKVSKGMDVVQDIEAIGSKQHGVPTGDAYMQTVLVDGKASDCPEPAGQPEDPEPFRCPETARQDLTGEITADVITPGSICITRTTDQALVWAQNDGDASATVEWSLTSPDGGDLPSGWSATFQSSTMTLRAGQTAHTLVDLRVPEGTSGSFALELHTGFGTTPVTAHVDLRHDLLTSVDDRVLLQYDGSCTATGDRFDAGSFGTGLGTGQTVAGFDLGLLGMGEKETTTIVIPAAMGYGNSGGPCAGDDADLTFEVTVLNRPLRHASELL